MWKILDFGPIMYALDIQSIKMTTLTAVLNFSSL